MTASGWQSEGQRPTAIGAALEPLGRAARSRCEDGEIWALQAPDERVARRLLLLGESNVGGFVAGGRDAEGVRLLRAVAPRTAESLARGEKLAWRDALAVVRDVGRAL